MDLKTVRNRLEQPEALTASTVAAREEIVRAVATKIKQGQWWEVSAIVPEVQKLFESPEERRLRLQRADERERLKRIRKGTITAAVGLGEVLFFLILSMLKAKILMFTGPGLIVFLIGLGIIINGLFFTTPRQPDEDLSLAPTPPNTSNQLFGDLTVGKDRPPSVTENTTALLQKKLINTDPLG
jgi:hypothetical protein